MQLLTVFRKSDALLFFEHPAEMLGIFESEAVCFIADRHHVTSQQLLRYFLYGEASIPLEANEVEILKGLSEQVKEDRITNIKTR